MNYLSPFNSLSKWNMGLNYFFSGNNNSSVAAITLKMLTYLWVLFVLYYKSDIPVSFVCIFIKNIFYLVCSDILYVYIQVTNLIFTPYTGAGLLYNTLHLKLHPEYHKIHCLGLLKQEKLPAGPYVCIQVQVLAPPPLDRGWDTR